MQEIPKTHQISPAIIDLISETKERCYLVTPYLKPWPLLDRTLARASEQRKRITFIIRTETEKLPYVRQLHRDYGFEVVVLDYLHTKLYLNERRAILSSMNLYDSSQERNYELAMQILNAHAVRKIKKAVVEEDLLALTPRLHLPGWFHQEQENLGAEMEALQNGFAEKGFCVTCGTKVDFEEKKILHPYFVRCRLCWSKAPEAEAWSFRIRFCHYCGGTHQSVLDAPYHSECQGLLKRYADWRG